jgi:hypothetical protein
VRPVLLDVTDATSIDRVRELVETETAVTGSTCW